MSEVNYKQELSLLLHMIDAASMQLAMIKDHPHCKQAQKKALNEYFSYARRFTREAVKGINQQQSDEIDNRTALVLSALKEIASAKSPVIALALLVSYNAGEVIIDE